LQRCRSGAAPFVFLTRFACDHEGLPVKYMLLIYTPDLGRDRTDEEWAEMTGPYMAYNAYVQASGAYVDGAPLDEISTATTVRIRDGKRVITDGPFAETKEFLGGFYMVDCASLDEALELAAACPGAAHGSIEVRPLLEGPARQDAT
jgi:hypothetical protein